MAARPRCAGYRLGRGDRGPLWRSPIPSWRRGGRVAGSGRGAGQAVQVAGLAPEAVGRGVARSGTSKQPPGQCRGFAGTAAVTAGLRWRDGPGRSSWLKDLSDSRAGADPGGVRPAGDFSAASRGSTRTSTAWRRPSGAGRERRRRAEAQACCSDRGPAGRRPSWAGPGCGSGTASTPTPRAGWPRTRTPRSGPGSAYLVQEANGMWLLGGHLRAGGRSRRCTPCWTPWPNPNPPPTAPRTRRHRATADRRRPQNPGPDHAGRPRRPPERPTDPRRSPLPAGRCSPRWKPSSPEPTRLAWPAWLAWLVPPR